MLFPGSAKPLYEQLKDNIKQSISSEELKPGDMLPGERVLMTSYRVSRATVRQAISELVKEGILYRHHGKGTFVAFKRVERPLARYMGIIEELRLEGTEANLVPIRSERIIPSSEVSKALNLREDEPAFLICRLVITDGEPILIHYSYYHQTVEHILKNLDLTEDVIFTRLEDYGFKIARGESRISSAAASAEVAKYLKCKVNDPILVAKKTAYVESNLPISYSYVAYRSDRYEYCIDLKRYLV